MNRVAFGDGRAVLISSGLAIKFARNQMGAEHNLLEAKGWLFGRNHALHRNTLCPVLWCSPTGAVSVMPAVQPLTEEEHKIHVDSFFDMFEYRSGDVTTRYNHEFKASSWGWLQGRIVCVDYQHSPLSDDWPTSSSD